MTPDMRECRACGPVHVPHYCDGDGDSYYPGHGLPTVEKMLITIDALEAERERVLAVVQAKHRKGAREKDCLACQVLNALHGRGEPKKAAEAQP